MNKKFFCPKIDCTPLVVTVVKVEKNIISYDDWVDALSLRINNLLSKERNPKKSARKACEMLQLPVCGDLSKFGEHLTVNNVQFREYFSLDSFDDEAFPFLLTSNNSDYENFYETTLEKWVENFCFALSGEMRNGLGLIDKNYEREISIPDQIIKPYVDFIHNSTLDAFCDFECTDPDECEVHTHLYKFGYFLSHRDGEVRLALVILPNRNTKFESLELFNEFVSNYNESHQTKISFRYETKRKFLIKKIYIPQHYYLHLEVPISCDAKLIAKTIKIFYSDIFDFYKNQTFDEIMPKANFKEDEGDSFLNYLEDEVVMLGLIEAGKLNWPLPEKKHLEN